MRYDSIQQTDHSASGFLRISSLSMVNLRSLVIKHRLSSLRLYSFFIILFFSLFVSNLTYALTLDNQVSAQAEKHLQATQNPTLIVGSEQDFPPFATGMTDATASGFTVDLWKAIAAEAGLNYTIRVLPFHQILQEFKDGKIDVLINLAQSDQRKQFADFTVSHVVVHGAIFVRKGETSIHSESDFSGKSIIVLSADLAHDYAVSKGWERQLVLVNTVEEGLRLLASGKHDAMLLSKLAGMQTLQATGLTNIEVLKTKAGFSQKFSFAVQKGQADLLGRINEALAVTKSNETYNKLYEKWFGIYETKEIGLRDILKYIIPISLIFIVALGNSYYRRQVERSLAVKALQKVNEKNLALLRNASDGIHILDYEGNIVEASDSFCGMLGYHRDEVIGMNVSQWDAGFSNVEEQLSVVRQQFSKTTRTQFETKHKRKDGTIFEVEVSGFPLELHGVRLLFNSSRDITQRKILEGKLQSTTEELEDLYDHAPCGYHSLGPDGKYLRINATELEWLGCTREDVIGKKSPKDFFTPASRDLFKQNLTKILRDGHIENVEFDIVGKNGAIKQVLLNASAIKDEQGNFFKSRSILFDISELKKVEKALQESEARFRVMANAAPVLIWVAGLDKGCHWFNDIWLRFTGRTMEQESGNGWAEGVHPDDFDRCLEIYISHFDRREAFRMEYRLRRHDGEYRWIDDHGIPLLDKDGNFSGYIGSCIDITETKQQSLELNHTLTSLNIQTERLQTILANASDAIHILDRKGNVVQFSESFANGLGYSHEEASHLNVADWEAQFSKEELTDVINHNLATTSTFESKHRRKDGSVFDVEINACEVKLEGESYLYASSRDISERKRIERKLNELSNDFITFLENSADFIYFKDKDSRFRFCSQSLARITGYNNWRDLVGKHDMEVFPEETAKIYYEEELPVFQDGEAILNRVDPYYDEAGNKGWVSTSKWPLKDAEGNVTGIFGVSRDVTAMQIAEEELRVAASAFETQEGMTVTDDNGLILRVNKAFTEITGYTQAEVIGQNTRMLQSGRHDKEFYIAMWASIHNTGAWQGEIWNRRKSGEVYPEYMCITAVKDSAGILTNYVGTFSDITQRKELEEAVLQLAFYDPLTKLPNRRLLNDRLSQARTASKRSQVYGALMFLDLDNFKPLNDTHGHAVGDLLLIETARRLESCIREMDTVARFGGDEFVVMLSELDNDQLTSKTEAKTVAEKIRNCISEPFILKVTNEDLLEETVEHHCTVSIGLTLFNGLEVSQEEVLKQADDAMYQTKEAGRNQIKFYGEKG